MTIGAPNRVRPEEGEQREPVSKGGDLTFHALPHLRTDEVADVLLIYYFWESWDGAQIRAAIHRRASPLPATRGEAG